MLKQAYQLKQAEYELARMKRGRGSVSVQDVARARVAYAKAAKEFQYFWDTKLSIN